MEADTIVAIVTPPGEGGVGIVRSSGPLSGTLPGMLFPTLKRPWMSHRMRHGPIVDTRSGETVDSGLGCLFCAPGSYTGEDVFEIHCHGSPLVLERILQLCFTAGCRAARPGEFTLRAFLHGRLDLSQAEAVIDVVRAQTNAGLHRAVRQLSGWLSERIQPVRQSLIGVLAHMEAMVDFVEDDIPPEIDSATREQLAEALLVIETLLAGADQGIVLRDGATLVIAGSPNVGKSSIMNALLGLDRSIVTPIAGTTRDTVEETLRVGDVPFRTVDTAGITDTGDVVEQIGVQRARQAMENADVVLLVVDRSRPLLAQDEMTIAAVEESRFRQQSDGRNHRLVLALNKADLPARVDAGHLLERLSPDYMVESSTVRMDGVDDLRRALEAAALGGQRHEYIVGNARHQDALQRASRALQESLNGLQKGTPLDLVSFDVREAANAVGEITGETVDDELLDRIFRDFCIGK